MDMDRMIYMYCILPRSKTNMRKKDDIIKTIQRKFDLTTIILFNWKFNMTRSVHRVGRLADWLVDLS